MIKIQNLSKAFGRQKVLDDVTLECKAGQCIALIGPNGSGKTTLIKTILGMVIPDAGEVIFNGKNIAHDWEYRRDIGYMPQIGRYPENMTIGQVISMMKDIRRQTEANLDTDLIKLFDIPSISEKRMRTLSGGTRQKVSACLALMFNSKVLILDEPTAGLDPVSTEIFKHKILKEKEKNKLIIITSHVLSELNDLVSEVIYMQDGKPAFYKSLKEIRQETGEEQLSKAIARIITRQTHAISESL